MQTTAGKSSLDRFKLFSHKTPLQFAALMDVKLQSLVSSSAADARSIENLKFPISNATACNRKWDHEGARLLQETKRLRSERDLARLLLPPFNPSSPRLRRRRRPPTRVRPVSVPCTRFGGSRALPVRVMVLGNRAKVPISWKGGLCRELVPDVLCT